MEKERHNIVDYVQQEMRPFSEWAFTEVDSLVLSELSYMRWASMDGAPSKLLTNDAPTLTSLNRAECFSKVFNTQLDNDLARNLWAAIAASPRFRDVRLTMHVDQVDEHVDKQFSATTFLLPTGEVYVAFRGTDNTLVGWKEDFNLAYMKEVPAQVASAAYLDKVAAGTTGPLLVGGHSKGGNLSVYSAARCGDAARARIAKVYSHDGPGFSKEALASVEYAAVTKLICKSVPESSIVGMVLEHQEAYHVVKSDASGIMQHDPFSWQITDGAFETVSQVDGSAGIVSSSLTDWFDSMDNDHLHRFVDMLFDVLGASGQKQFQDMTPSDYAKSLEALGALDPDDRKVLTSAVGALVAAAGKNIIPGGEEMAADGVASIRDRFVQAIDSARDQITQVAAPLAQDDDQEATQKA